MKNLLNKFQKNMAAATFAEADESDTEKKIAPATKLPREPNWMSKIFMAVTFAESGLVDDAIRLMGSTVDSNRGANSTIAEELGLRGVRLMYGTVSI